MTEATGSAAASRRKQTRLESERELTPRDLDFQPVSPWPWRPRDAVSTGLNSFELENSLGCSDSPEACVAPGMHKGSLDGAFCKPHRTLRRGFRWIWKGWKSCSAPGFRAECGVMRLVDLLKRHEGKTLQFKRDLSSPEGILKTLVAFANTAGGTVVIGVEDGSRNVRGLPDVLAAEEKLASLVSVSISPRLVPDIEVVAWRNPNVLTVQVYPSNTPTTNCSGSGQKTASSSA